MTRWGMFNEAAHLPPAAPSCQGKSSLVVVEIEARRYALRSLKKEIDLTETSVENLHKPHFSNPESKERRWSRMELTGIYGETLNGS
jgi:hypothetical protein